MKTILGRVAATVLTAVLALAALAGLSKASAVASGPILCLPGLGCLFTASRPAADTGVDFVLDTVSTRTGGKLLSVRNNGTEKVAYDFNGKPIVSCAATKTAGAAVCGTAALDTSGTVTIATSAITAGSLIDVQMITAGGTAGGLYRAAPADITAGTSFIVRSFVASTAGAATAATSDTSTIFWQILN